MLIAYREFTPVLAAPFDLAPTAAVIGRTKAGPRLTLRAYATVRADGESIRIGANACFGARATVHIADSELGAVVGDDLTVGRYGIVHACTVGDGVVVADAAAVMDAAVIGPHALIAPAAIRVCHAARPTAASRYSPARRRSIHARSALSASAEIDVERAMPLCFMGPRRAKFSPRCRKKVSAPTFTGVRVSRWA